MSAEAAILTRSWTVGSRTCTLSVPRPQAGEAAHVCVEWEPSQPTKLTGEEWHEYRAGRDAALAELAQILGGSVAVLEL